MHPSAETLYCGPWIAGRLQVWHLFPLKSVSVFLIRSEILICDVSQTAQEIVSVFRWHIGLQDLFSFLEILSGPKLGCYFCALWIDVRSSALKHDAEFISIFDMASMQRAYLRWQVILAVTFKWINAPSFYREEKNAIMRKHRSHPDSDFIHSTTELPRTTADRLLPGTGHTAVEVCGPPATGTQSSKKSG